MTFTPAAVSDLRSNPPVITSGPLMSSEDGELARLLLQPVRLGIVRALLAQEALSFTDLKRLMKISDGNLSVHARKLEDAQVLTCTKGFRGRLPRTEYSLTPAGRATVEKLLAAETRARA